MQIVTRRSPNVSDLVGEQLQVAPTQPAVDFVQAKKQIEIAYDDTTHDDHLANLIAAATAFIENQLRIQLIQATWEFVYDRFPSGREPLFIPRPPLQSVTSITYLDTAGASQTMPTADYKVGVSREPGRVSLKSSASWPTTTDEAEAVKIVAVCGYPAPPNLPAEHKTVLLMIIDDWFNNRSGQGEMTKSVKALMGSLSLGFGYSKYAPVVGDAPRVGAHLW